MLALLTAPTAIRHRGTGDRKHRRLVALAKGLKHRKGGDSVDGDLGEVNHSRNAQAVFEVLGGQRRKILFHTVAEGVEVAGIERDAHGTGMAAEADEQVRAALDGLEEVDVADASARAARHAVGDGEEDDRHMVETHDTARDDALDAFVPPLTAHDDDAPTLVGCFDKRVRVVKQLALDGTALAVDVLKAHGDALGLLRVALHKKVKCDGRVVHPTCGVHARDKGEGQIVGRHLGEVATGLHRKRSQTGVFNPTQARDALGHKRAVLAGKQHHVAHRAQRGDVGVLAPQVGLAHTVAELVNDLEGNADTGKLARRALGVELGVAHRHALRHEVAGLMVVGHSDIDAALEELRALPCRGDAGVDGDDEVGGAHLQQPLDGDLRQAVAFAEALGDERGDVAAEVAQTARQKAGGADAVDVEVTEDRNVLPCPKGMLQAGNDGIQAWDEKRVGPVTVERRREKVPGLLRIADTPASHDARGKRRHPAGVLDELSGAGVEGNDLPAPVAGQGRH